MVADRTVVASAREFTSSGKVSVFNNNTLFRPGIAPIPNNKTFDDAAREKVVQQASLRLLGTSGAGEPQGRYSDLRRPPPTPISDPG